MSQDSPFDRASQDFLEYEKTVVGQLRYTLARENLLPYLLPVDKGTDENNPTILDACGGSGPDTAWLAELDYRVCLVDPSLDQLNLAKKRFESLTDDQVSRIEAVQSDIAGLDESYKGFDGALSHVVASYLEDPLVYLAQVTKRIKKGGVLSVLENGEEGAWQILKGRRNDEELEKFKETKRYINNIGLEVRAFTFEKMESLLQQIGMQILTRAGIRIQSNYIRRTVTDYGQSRFEELIEKERKLSKDPVQMHKASLIQVIAQKI